MYECKQSKVSLMFVFMAVMMLFLLDARFINRVQFVFFKELFTDRPAVAASAVVPGSQRS